jgi:hypothetical protein
MIIDDILQRAARVLYAREREANGVRDSVALVASRLKLTEAQACAMLGLHLGLARRERYRMAAVIHDAMAAANAEGDLADAERYLRDDASDDELYEEYNKWNP